jgi:hypothetical protein
MAESYLERRREPRRAASGMVHSDRTVATSVRVLDIGLSGVLVASSLPFQIGQIAHLSTRFGERPIDADVEVRRVVPPNGDRIGYRVGARFVSLDEATRQSMQKFLADRNR